MQISRREFSKICSLGVLTPFIPVNLDKKPKYFDGYESYILEEEKTVYTSGYYPYLHLVLNTNKRRQDIIGFNVVMLHPEKLYKAKVRKFKNDKTDCYFCFDENTQLGWWEDIHFRFAGSSIFNLKLVEDFCIADEFQEVFPT